MWVASPSAYHINDLMIVDYYGKVGWNSYDFRYLGFRPIVCLKSDTQLIKNEDGSYTIYAPPKNNNIESSDYGAEVKGYDCENSAGV